MFERWQAITVTTSVKEFSETPAGNLRDKGVTMETW